MTRGRGGFIGTNIVPAAAEANSAASGLWTLRDVESFQRALTWPVSPPGGVSAGMQLWLDASDANTLYDATTGGSLVAADGGVARWEDKSGNGRHATQATSGSRPLRKDAVQNGRNVLRFDGSSSFFSLSPIAIPASYSAFFVFSRPSQDAHSIIIGNTQELTADNRYLAWWFSDNVVYSKSNADFSTHGAASTSAGAFLVSDIRNGTTSVATRRNGLSLATVTTGNAISNATAGNLDLVGRNQSVCISGDICEIILYDSALADARLAATESYLMTKWGIA
jgi:hypothetical protein